MIPALYTLHRHIAGPTHWFRLPLAIRTRIWRAYRPGQGSGQCYDLLARINDGDLDVYLISYR